MDALKLLKEETARKRKALNENGIKGKKYIKRSELERISRGQDEDHNSGDDSDTKRGGASSQSKSSGGERSGKSQLLSPTSLVAPPEMEAAIFSIPRSEVVRRLRERGEPIRLFGESDRDVCIRLRQIEILAPEINKGLRNDFKDAMDKLDQEYLDQLAKHEGDGGESSDLKFKDDGTTMEELVAAIDDLTGDDENKKQDLCLKTFKLLLKEWVLELNSRPMLEKRSYQGKMASAKLKQTESYLSPLFKQLRKKTTPPDILNFLCRICVCVLNREYIQANDAYLSMAIGNAPWPIGVTMVGIHARTGREKIFSQQIAHVLNDETQRKYIQAVKRLMTFAQRKFPTDPSKCVEYEGIKT